MICKFSPGDTVTKLPNKIDGCCGSSLMAEYKVKSIGVYEDTNRRKIPLIELDCVEFYREDQLVLVKKGEASTES